MFPQLAVAAGAVKQLIGSHSPVVAWFFNTTFTSERQAKAARRAAGTRRLHGGPLDPRDRLIRRGAWIRHSRSSSTFRFSTAAKYRRFPSRTARSLSCSRPVLGSETTGRSSRRSEALDLPTKVVASDRVLKGLDVPSNVEVLNHLKGPEIRDLMRRARVNVVPLGPDGPHRRVW